MLYRYLAYAILFDTDFTLDTPSSDNHLLPFQNNELCNQGNFRACKIMFTQM